MARIRTLHEFLFLLNDFRENDEENLAHTVFTQYINEQENQMEAELAFDASFFKANRKVNCTVSDLSFIPHSRGPYACLSRSLCNKDFLIKPSLRLGASHIASS